MTTVFRLKLVFSVVGSTLLLIGGLNISIFGTFQAVLRHLPCYEKREELVCFLSGPRCLLSSLEYVDIERPLKGEAMEMQLLSYFLENSGILKKLTVCFDASMKRKRKSAIFKELLTVPRLSNSCQVVVL